MPCSPTNPSHPQTQKSPQTGTLGCPAQASEDELAKNKSLSSKQLLLISLAGENGNENVQQIPFPVPQPAHSSQPGCGARGTPPPAPTSSVCEVCSLSPPFCWRAAHSRSPGMTRFVILSHPRCCCSTAGPAVSIANAPVSSLRTT